MSTMPRPSLFGAWLLVLGFASGCAVDTEVVPPRKHGEVGGEVFRLVCMNLAAQAYPNDLTGVRFARVCDGQAPANGDDLPERDGEKEERAYARYEALLARREELVPALEIALNTEYYQPDQLRTFLSNMVPLYDPPEQLPTLTRGAAKLLVDVIEPDLKVSTDTIAALERMSPRDGYRPARYGLGMTRALLGYPRFDDVLRTVLDAVDINGGPARAEFVELLRASALDLATADRKKPDPNDPGSLTLALQLLFSEADAFKGEDSKSTFVTARDERGVAKLASVTVAPPFVDNDGDERADVDARGHFVLTSGAAEVTPYATFAAGSQDAAQRDANGRALNGQGEPLYQSFDADRTMIAGALREAKPLLEHTADKRAAIEDMTYGLNSLIGDWKQRNYTFGKKQYSFNGPDTSTGPMFDFIYALTSVLPLEQTEDFLTVIERLVSDHEGELAGLTEAMLYIKERSELYPNAQWEHPHDFFDDTIALVIDLYNRPGVIEGLLRALTDDNTPRIGPFLGNWMRFKDPVSYPLGTRGELAALGIDPLNVPGHLAEACSGPECGRPCNLTDRCPSGMACVVKKARDPNGTCGSIADAVRAHRVNLNYPCLNPPVEVLGGEDTEDPNCKPTVLAPSPHHRGIRGCPVEKPEDGSSCAAAGGFGLCSWDAGSCTCDCNGGLCRHGAVPTWHCSKDVTPGFSQWVDRDQPDNRTTDDGIPNVSILQRVAGLTWDLHVPNTMCNKQDAQLVLYSPAGSNTRFIPAALDPLLTNIPVVNNIVTTLLGPFDACKLLEEKQIVQFFLRAPLGYGKVPVNADYERTINGLLPIVGLTLDDVMERQMQIRGLKVVKPTAQAISRMVFGPFLPFQEGIIDLVKSRDGLNMVDLYQDTILAWELPDPISGATVYNEAFLPIWRALDVYKGEKDGFIGSWADMAGLVQRHWASRASDTTNRACDDSTTPPKCDEKAALFSYKSNGHSYEELVAEALVDAKLLSRVGAVMKALDAIELPNGKDGITVLTEAIHSLLIPQPSCLDGDCTNHPLAYRDGRTETATNTGKLITPVSPVYLLLDALNGIDARFEEAAHKARLKPWRSARSQLVDVFFEVDRSPPAGWRFKNSRARDVMVAGVRFVRDRLREYKQQEADCLSSGAPAADCHKVHEWALGLTKRLETSLGQPVSAATLRLLEKLRDLPSDPGGKFMDLLKYLVTEKAGDDTFAGTLVGAADLAQTLQDSENLGPLMTFVAGAISDNANDVAIGTAPDVDIDHGTVQKTLTLFQALQDIAPETATDKSSLAALMTRLTTRYGAHGETPLDVIIDGIVAVNRAAPMPHGDAAMSSDDVRALFRETADFLQSERHGLERLYDVVQSRSLP